MLRILSILFLCLISAITTTSGLGAFREHDFGWSILLIGFSIYLLTKTFSMMIKKQ